MNLKSANGTAALTLVPASPVEREAVLKINSAAWKGPLSVDDYINREYHLGRQKMTGSRLTRWILVDNTQPVNERTILSSCETFEKDALVAYQGDIQRVLTVGVGSVFCREEFRGLGYAKQMMEELCRIFDGKRGGDNDKKKKTPLFTVLFSDIGKRFYARFGWKPFPSSHIALPPIDEM